jgi:hypothetical protein
MRRGLAIGMAACTLGATGLAGCGGGGSSALKLPFHVAPFASSWVTGQPNLLSVSEYVALEQRALPLAQIREAAYQNELVAILKAKLAAKKQAKADALRKYLEAKRRAERLYKEALKKAAEARKKQQELLRKARLERARKLRELLRKLRIKPGQECQLPEVQAEFHCLPGRYPLRAPPKHPSM